MKSASHTIGEELRMVLIFVALVWAVFLLDWVLPGNFNNCGLTPRQLSGAIGIPTMPFLHGGWGHLLRNTIPLFVLLCLLAGSKSRSWAIVIDVILLGGMLLWIFGTPGIHIGASGLVFGLIAFLLLSGVFERRFIPMLVSVVVAVLYGGTLIRGVLPVDGPRVSWTGHLCGAVAGGIVAYVLTRPRKPKKKEPPI